MANAFASQRLGVFGIGTQESAEAGNGQTVNGERGAERGRPAVASRPRSLSGSHTAHTAAGCLDWQNETAWFRGRDAMRRPWCAVQPETRRRGSERASSTRPVGTGALQLTVGSEPGLYRSWSRDSGSGKSQSQRCVGFLQRIVPRNRLNRLNSLGGVQNSKSWQLGPSVEELDPGEATGDRREAIRRSKEIRPPWLAARQREPEKLKLPGLAPNGNPNGIPKQVVSGGPGSAVGVVRHLRACILSRLDRVCGLPLGGLTQRSRTGGGRPQLRAT